MLLNYTTGMLDLERSTTNSTTHENTHLLLPSGQAFPLQPEDYYVAAPLYALFGLTAIVGNSLIVYVQHASPELRGKQAFVVPLALSDLTNGAAACVRAALPLVPAHSLSGRRCMLLEVPMILSITCGTAFTFALAATRLAIFRLSGGDLKRFKARLRAGVFVAVPLYSAAVSLLMVAGAAEDRTVSTCTFAVATAGAGLRLFKACGFSLTAAVLAVNVLLYRTVRKRLADARFGSKDRDTRIAVSMIMVCSTYVVTWVLAIGVFVGMESLDAPPAAKEAVYPYLGVLTAANSATNIFIYTLRGKEYRDALRCGDTAKTPVLKVTNTVTASVSPRL